MTLPVILRVSAIAIAIAGVIDPAVTVNRPVKATIALVDLTRAGAADAHLADRVARALDGKFAVVRHPLPGAAAVIVVGDRPPALDTADAALGFAITPDPVTPAFVLDAVRAPERAPFDTRVTVAAAVRSSGGKEHHVEVALSTGGLVVDRVTHDVTEDVDRFDATLAFIPTAEGIASLRVTVRDTSAASPAAAADLSVNVERRQWSVLIFDAHPSWASTFVRRALEHDARFAVTTRIDTSRDVNTSFGRPPASLANVSALVAYDAIVVGAPGDLTAADVAGIEAFARRRGGAAIIMLDAKPTGALERLIGVDRWTESTQAAPIGVDASAPEPARLLASELVWPVALPPGADALASVSLNNASHAVVWQMPVGAGRLIVSGAIDAWRARMAHASFDQYWRAVVADAAQAAPAPLALTVAPGVITAGDTATVSLTMRDLALNAPDGSSTVRAEVSARLEGPEGTPGLDGRSEAESPTMIRLWPDGEPGRWRGIVRAPARAGGYRLVASSGGNETSAPLMVASAAASGAMAGPSDGGDLLRAWASSRAGTTLPASRANEITSVLERALPSSVAPERWRPLRSGWWIMPFALLLGGEWWWRRRRGLA